MKKKKKQQPLKVSCDNCKKEFKLKFQIKKIKDDIERVYFVCPKCKKEYTCYYTNDLIKDKQNQLRELSKLENLEHTEKKRTTLKRELSMLIELLKAEMEENIE